MKLFEVGKFYKINLESPEHYWHYLYSDQDIFLAKFRGTFLILEKSKNRYKVLMGKIIGYTTCLPTVLDDSEFEEI